MAEDIAVVTDEELSTFRNCARSVKRDNTSIDFNGLANGTDSQPPVSGSVLDWLQKGPAWAELVLEEIARLRRRCASHAGVLAAVESRNAELEERAAAADMRTAETREELVLRGHELGRLQEQVRGLTSAAEINSVERASRDS